MKLFLILSISLLLGFSSCAQSITKPTKEVEVKKPKRSTVMTKPKTDVAEVSAVLPSHLPFYEIPEYPESFSAPNVLARTIDGLGYRYHWATQGLTDNDLAYKPSDDGRSADETLDHLHGLALFINNSITGNPNIRPRPAAPESWADRRKETLDNLKQASDLLKKMDNIDKLKIEFQRGEKTSEVSLWHLFNGPLADALYHVGQIVVFRRAAGNPMHPGVNVFMGKTELK